MRISFVIFSGGKTGSSTLLETFKDKGCIRVHSDLNFIQTYPDIVFRKNVRTVKELINSFTHNIFVIDIYRDPIERLISSFFEHIDDILPGYNDSLRLILNYFINSDYHNTIEDYHPLDDIFPDLFDDTKLL